MPRADAIAVVVGVGGVEQGLPAANVRPAHRHRDDRNRGLFLHHRIVDRLRGRAREGLAGGADRAAVPRGGVERGARGADDVGHVALHRGEPDRRAGKEYPGVPIMPAGVEHRLRAVGVGLLDEALDPAHAPALLSWAPRAPRYIAEAGGGMIGLDPEGDDVPCLGGASPRFDRGVKGGHIGDMLVARAHEQQIVGRGNQRGERDRRGAVALHRLEDQDRFLDRPEQSGQFARLRLIGDDDRRAELRRVGEARERLLEQARRPDQRQQMLGPRRGRHRPQPRPRSASQDNRANKPLIGHAIHAPSLPQSRGAGKGSAQILCAAFTNHL